jgi:uroporphyrinogen-III synthase
VKTVRLLVTRPEPDGERTAAALRARGHHVMAAALLQMQAMDCEIPSASYSAIVMTSANAARAVAEHPRRAELISLPVFAVGAHTAELARTSGFPEVHSAAGDKQQLSAMLAQSLAGGPHLLLYLAGEDRAGELEVAECARVVTAVIYRMVKRRKFDATVEAALAQGEIDGVLHFSRRSAEAYLDCAVRSDIRQHALAPVHYCLSRQVAAPLAEAGVAAIRIPPRPDEAALIELVDS